MEIAGLVALGLSDKEVANELGLTEKTVGWHLKSIFKKWRIHSRSLLAAQSTKATGQQIPRQATPSRT
jgi:DNA-binding NarL/FixJ family response regulator